MRYAVVLCDPYSTDEIHGLIGPFEDRGQAEAHLTGLLGQGLNPDSLAHVQDDRRGYPTTTGIIAIYDHLDGG